MKNIISHLGTDHFPRIRIGIGEKPANWDLADYVLSPFSREDRGRVDEAVEDAAKALQLILEGSMDEAMNRYNKKAKENTKAKEGAKAGKGNLE